VDKEIIRALLLRSISLRAYKFIKNKKYLARNIYSAPVDQKFQMRARNPEGFDQRFVQSVPYVALHFSKCS
jgi:hypothetical protein